MLFRSLRLPPHLGSPSRRPVSGGGVAPAATDHATGAGRVQVPPTLQSIWNAALAWLNGHEALFIFLAILLEESGIPMPIPADIAMAVHGVKQPQQIQVDFSNIHGVDIAYLVSCIEPRGPAGNNSGL